MLSAALGLGPAAVASLHAQAHGGQGPVSSSCVRPRRPLAPREPAPTGARGLEPFELEASRGEHLLGTRTAGTSLPRRSPNVRTEAGPRPRLRLRRTLRPAEPCGLGGWSWPHRLSRARVPHRRPHSGEREDIISSAPSIFAFTAPLGLFFPLVSEPVLS